MLPKAGGLPHTLELPRGHGWGDVGAVTMTHDIVIHSTHGVTHHLPFLKLLTWQQIVKEKIIWQKNRINKRYDWENDKKRWGENIHFLAIIVGSTECD